ncbi:MAG: hydroxylamine reductase, partial [Desulfohalobiaceae bacterium]
MFCFQCQETAKNEGCTVKGMCGKPEETADLQDLLIYICKGISVYGEKLQEKGTVDREAGKFICEALFTTITNVAWDDEVIMQRIQEAFQVRDKVKAQLGGNLPEPLPECGTWYTENKDEMKAKALSEEMRITAV